MQALRLFVIAATSALVLSLVAGQPPPGSNNSDADHHDNPHPASSFDWDYDLNTVFGGDTDVESSDADLPEPENLFGSDFARFSAQRDAQAPGPSVPSVIAPPLEPTPAPAPHSPSYSPGPLFGAWNTEGSRLRPIVVTDGPPSSSHSLDSTMNASANVVPGRQLRSSVRVQASGTSTSAAAAQNYTDEVDVVEDPLFARLRAAVLPARRRPGRPKRVSEGDLAPAVPKRRPGRPRKSCTASIPSGSKGDRRAKKCRKVSSLADGGEASSGKGKGKMAANLFGDSEDEPDSARDKGKGKMCAVDAADAGKCSRNKGKGIARTQAGSGFDNVFADPRQVGGHVHHADHDSGLDTPADGGDYDINAELQDFTSGDESEDDTLYRVHVFRRFWWKQTPVLSDKQQLARAKIPSSLRPELVKVWKLRESNMHDTDPDHTFDWSIKWDHPRRFRRRAEEILVQQFEGALVYMNSGDPVKFTTLYACICYRTNKRAPPQEDRIKKQFNVDDPVQWAKFLSELAIMPPSNWAAALFEMTHPDAALANQQVVYDEAASYAAWQADQYLGSVPQPIIPHAADPQLESSLARALKQRYTTGQGTGDNMIVRSRMDPRDSFRLTARRIGLWADAWARCQRANTSTVDLETPPVSPEFLWVRNEAERPHGYVELNGFPGEEPAPPYQHPPPYPENDQTFQSQPTPAASTSQTPYNAHRDPPASAFAKKNLSRKLYNPTYCGTFDDFLDFALIPREDFKTRQRLSKGGFFHWSSLQASPTLSPDHLTALEIPQGMANALIRFAGEFLEHVEECIRRGGWFDPDVE